MIFLANGNLYVYTLVLNIKNSLYYSILNLCLMCVYEVYGCSVVSISPRSTDSPHPQRTDV